MDDFLQRVLDMFSHRVLTNMTPDRRAVKLAVVNNLAGNAKSDKEKMQNSWTNLRALKFKSGEERPTDGENQEFEENVKRLQGCRMTPRNEQATEELKTHKREVKRCRSIPVEVHKSQKHGPDLEEPEFDAFSQNLLTMPSISVTNLLEEIESDLPPPYSLANVLDHTPHTITNLRTWARLSRVGSHCIQVEENTKLFQNPESDIGNKIKNLKEQAFVQKMLIEQAEKAVSLCKVRKRNFDVEDLESVRVLLMAKLRYEVINLELQKLEFSGVGEPIDENSCELEILDVCFTERNSKNYKNDHYICIAYHKERLFASHVQSEIINGKLHFPVNFKFDDLRQNFIVYLELYRLNCCSQIKKNLKNVFDVKNLIKIGTRKMIRYRATMSTERDFECIGSGTIRLADVRCREKGKFSVHFQAGSYPAFGNTVSLNVRTKLALKSKINGFLDVFKNLCWHRLWCCPVGHALQFWCYPEDKDNEKAPVESVILPPCQENIQPISMDVCIRPHSFMITYKESEKGILLSASSHKDMINWINFLRSAARCLEDWAPDF